MKYTGLVFACVAFTTLQIFLVATLGGQDWLNVFMDDPIDMEERNKLARRMDRYKIDGKYVSARHLLHTLDSGRNAGNIRETIASLEYEDEGKFPEQYEGWRSKGCRTGHIWDLGNVCPTEECLKRLDFEYSPDSNFQARSNNYKKGITKSALEDISYLRGKHHEVHRILLAILTLHQWRNNVFGSIGEIGVGEGKFSNILTFNVNHDVGEKLIFSDSFRHGSLNINSGEQFENFVSAMQHRNLTFEEKVSPGEKRAHLHTSHPAKLKLEHLKMLDIPQFRMIFIDSYGDPIKLVTHLENAVCMIRDGGIIAVDDFDNENIQATISNFLRSLGETAAVVPLVQVHNKLYLCTTNWHSKYLRLLKDKSGIMNIDIKKASKVTFCGERYLVIKS